MGLLVWSFYNLSCLYTAIPTPCLCGFWHCDIPTSFNIFGKWFYTCLYMIRWIFGKGNKRSWKVLCHRKWRWEGMRLRVMCLKIPQGWEDAISYRQHYIHEIPDTFFRKKCWYGIQQLVVRQWESVTKWPHYHGLNMLSSFQQPAG